MSVIILCKIFYPNAKNIRKTELVAFKLSNNVEVWRTRYVVFKLSVSLAAATVYVSFMIGCTGVGLAQVFHITSFSLVRQVYNKHLTNPYNIPHTLISTRMTLLFSCMSNKKTKL